MDMTFSVIAQLVTAAAVGVMLACPVEPAVSRTRDNVFYVATNGNDAWSGQIAAPNHIRSDGPFATIARARDAVRSLRAQPGQGGGAIEVVIRGGTYVLTAPVTLTPEDSGAPDRPVIYRAYPRETPVISSGQPLRGWVQHEGHIFKCSVAGVAIGSVPLRHLFYRGQPQVLARYPNFRPADPLRGEWMLTKKMPVKDTLGLPVVRKGWDSSEAELVVFQPDVFDWLTNVLPFKRIDAQTGEFELATKPLNGFSSGRRCYVRNVFEELDAPGEWFLDRETSTLYFWPPDDQPPADGAVTLPVLNRLVETAGDPNAGRYVEHVQFRGLTFRETTAEERGGIECPSDGALRLGGARACRVAQCRVVDPAANAITIEPDSREITVEGCEISGAGSCGVYVPPGLELKAPGSTLTRHRIRGNDIYDCSRLHKGTGAIEMWTAGGNLIEHNYLHDLPRWGVAMPYTAEGHNIIRYNEMRRTCLETSDCGPIHTSSKDGGGAETGVEVCYNLFVSSPGIGLDHDGKPESPTFSTGIYLDTCASGYHVHHNVVVGPNAWGGFWIQGGHSNLIENNIFVGATVAQGTITGNSNRNRVVRNIFYAPASDGTVFQWLWGPHDLDPLTNSDRNLIFVGGKPLKVGEITGLKRSDDSWAFWQQHGLDTHSVIADPLFVDPAKENFRLRPGSPALALGFKPFDLKGVGLSGYRPEE